MGPTFLVIRRFRVIRHDLAEYPAMGVNEQEQVQTLYWGPRLPDRDRFAEPKALPGMESFDPPITTTPDEFVGWGGGLAVEPSLKITFTEQERDQQEKARSLVPSPFSPAHSTTILRRSVE